MSGPLVLLTRPRRESRQAAAALRAGGFEVIRAPLQSTRRAPHSRALAEDLAWAASASIHVFVSRAAVAAASVHAATMLKRAPLRVAVGRTTAAALDAKGMDSATAPPGAEDSEGTLGLSVLQSVHGQRIALWVAPGGRDKLAQTLRQRGAEVRNIMIYRRLPRRPPARVMQQLRRAADRLVLTATSAGLLEQLDAQLTRAQLTGVRTRPLIVASERIAQAARAKGYSSVHIARGAGAEALIEALKSLNP